MDYATANNEYTEWIKTLRASSFNLDFGTIYTNYQGYGVASSNQPGHWVDVPLGTTSGLINIKGVATPVNIYLTGSVADYGPLTGYEDRLLRDGILYDAVTQHIPVSATLSGLPDGLYKVFYYSLVGASGIRINGIAANDLAGGAATSYGVEGTNWGVANNVTVKGGTLTITLASIDGKGLSGIQLIYVRIARPPVSLAHEQF